MLYEYIGVWAVLLLLIMNLGFPPAKHRVCVSTVIL